MSEIKFRAWDKKNKRMFNPCMIEFAKEHGKFEEDGRELYIWRRAYEDEDVNWSSTCNGTEKSVLMQYTGSHDKKDNEIYEGDIFFVYGEYDNGLHVEDESGYVYVDYNEKYGMYMMKSCNGEWLDPLCDYLNEDSFEDEREGMVIGNVHENLELLEWEEAE